MVRTIPEIVSALTTFLDCCAGICAIVFVAGRLIAPDVNLYVVKAAPVLFAGTCGMLIRMFVGFTSNSRILPTCAFLAALGFAMFGIGDCFIDISTDSALDINPTVGTAMEIVSGVVFSTGNLALLAALILSFLGHTTNREAQRTLVATVSLIPLIVAFATTCCVIVVAMFWIVPVKPLNMLYVAWELVCLWLTTLFSHRAKSTIAVLGVAVFIASDAVLFSLSSSFITIRPPLDNVVVMIMYWVACVLVIHYHRFTFDSYYMEEFKARTKAIHDDGEIVTMTVSSFGSLPPAS